MKPEDAEILAVIPARGGSKGLPGKNIRMLCGHPLIAFSVASALQSLLVNRVICSTDSQKIAHIAKEYGAEVPFMRPAELASDDSTDLEVFLHLLEWLEKREGYQPDYIIQLRPTSPLRLPWMVDAGIEALHNQNDADSLRTVCLTNKTPYKMWKIDQDSGFLHPILKLKDIAEPYNSPRQILPPIWWQTGTLDITTPEVIVGKLSMTGEKILPLVIDQEIAVDIDSIEDFRRAEKILEKSECIRPI